MRKLLAYICSVCIAALLFTACKKDKPTGIYMGYDYFPINIGHWVIYNVDSVYLYPFKLPYQIDTDVYQVKEVIDSLYTNNLGQRTAVIDKFKRLPDSVNWVYQKTYTANLSPTEALRKEDNVTYVKLIFPVTATSTWNGGAFNSGEYNSGLDWDESNFQYTIVNTPATINSIAFDSTLTVLQCDNQNFTQYQYIVEQYATGVGLIYKQIINMVSTRIVLPPNPPPVLPDSLWTSADYIYLTPQSIILQGSLLNYTETYVSSGN